MGFSKFTGATIFLTKSDEHSMLFKQHYTTGINYDCSTVYDDQDYFLTQLEQSTSLNNRLNKKAEFDGQIFTNEKGQI